MGLTWRYLTWQFVWVSDITRLWQTVSPEVSVVIHESPGGEMESVMRYCLLCYSNPIIRKVWARSMPNQKLRTLKRGLSINNPSYNHSARVVTFMTVSQSYVIVVNSWNTFEVWQVECSQR